MLRFFLYAAAFMAVIPLWRSIRGPSPPPSAIDMAIAAFPLLLLLSVGARQLGNGLLMRERSERRTAALGALGSKLLGITEATQIVRNAWRTATELHAVTPELRMLKVTRRGAAILIIDALGDFNSLPAAVNADLFDSDVQQSKRIPETSQVLLNDALGGRFRWTCIELPERDAFLLAALPTNASADVLVILDAFATVIALSLRSAIVHQQLTSEATTDSLTNLANRASFMEALARCLADPSTRPASVLFLDLDDFKYVNDAHGHQTGDDVLCGIAAILRRATRPEDVCARLGGDEFAVLITNTDSKSAENVARRIVSAVSAPMQLRNCVAHIGVSIGVAVAIPGDNIADLLQRADTAMYAAKARGKNRIEIYSPLPRTDTRSKTISH